MPTPSIAALQMNNRLRHDDPVPKRNPAPTACIPGPCCGQVCFNPCSPLQQRAALSVSHAEWCIVARFSTAEEAMNALPHSQCEGCHKYGGSYTEPAATRVNSVSGCVPKGAMDLG